MILNKLIELALELEKQGYGELEVILNSEYKALDLEYVKIPIKEYIDVCGN